MNFLKPTFWHPSMGLGPKPQSTAAADDEVIEPFIPPPPDADYTDESYEAGGHTLARALSGNAPSRTPSRAPSRGAEHYPTDFGHNHDLDEQEIRLRALSRAGSQRVPSRTPSRVPSRGPSPQPQSILRAPSTQPPPLQGRNDELFVLRAYKFRPSRGERGEWKHFRTSGIRPSAEESREWLPHTELRIITWNVDFMTPHHEDRLHAALRHIEEVVLGCKGGEAPPMAVCIMLQEVFAPIVPFLLQDPWVRRWFVVTPFTTAKWPDGAQYGNVTLVSRSLDIAECHILHYGLTHMQRSAVCVKVKLVQPGTREKFVLSIVNTHLESLPVGAQVRPLQLQLCSRFLHLRGTQGGVIAGDMNAISPRDGKVVKELRLKDAWRRGDEAEAGKTWGYQGQNTQNFPSNRLDKILYLPNRGYKVTEPTLIGVGLKVGHGKHALWVSDHYGLEATLRMSPPRNSF
ncbi:hypothetical protein D9619_004949 [Psilocybe cf. subviscida]|uniref:Endonuclease/exonuclease/phosphatase domain-containing protein n=1 Tax=Psilocybe cf. subviscida TaxID=2480587 RepID=A0A8H5BSZ1_9AGAR|nr:hypothetical protein D9619_004949 [Psilocybe cf. subviscida]